MQQEQQSGILSPPRRELEIESVSQSEMMVWDAENDWKII